MTVVTEPHPDDSSTGQVLLTGTEAYSAPEYAEVAGTRQLDAARTLPTPDHLEPA